MNIYGDESGSINNHSHETHFVITLIKTSDSKALKRRYKRFVSNNLERLKELDLPRYYADGTLKREGYKMFDHDGNFIELKGSQFDREMKIKFIENFIEVQNYEIYFIQYNNRRLTDGFCADISTAFNYPFRLAVEYFYKNGYFDSNQSEACNIQLDVRNEKTDKKFFLEQYLNTELRGRGLINHNINVEYFDSKNNKLVQLADVYSNIFYSHLKTNGYNNELTSLREKGILRFVFKFPLL